MSEIVLPFHFEPRPYQLPLWEAFDSGKFNRYLLIWHRRAGKDKCCWNVLIRQSQERVGSYFYFLPTYQQGRKIIWEGMDFNGYSFLNHVPEEVRKGKPNSTEMKLELRNGSIIRIVGSDKIDSIVGTNPVGCVFSEYSLIDPNAWNFIRPILRENGGWALFNGTPRGKQNHLYKMWKMAQENESWYCQVMTIEDTGVMTAKDVEEERKAGMDEELIQQEFYCSFEGGVSGSFYARQMQEAEEAGRITHVPYDASLPVNTWWDLGMSDSTAIIFTQSEPGTGVIRVIDYHEATGEGLPYYASLLQSLPYVYGDHIGPHDLAVREFGSGRTRMEMARDLGIRFKLCKRLPLEDGINAVRMLIPMLYFDREKCERLIDALFSYHKKWDGVHHCWGDKPDHDWSSHGADAIRTGAVGRRNARIPDREQRYQLNHNLYGRPRTSWKAA